MLSSEELIARMSTGTIDREIYSAALERFDVAVCEAMAVGQAQANRMAEPCIAYATHVHSRMCVHGGSAMRAAPLSRWVKSDHQSWHFGAVAPHARAILEGLLYFAYLMQPHDEDLEESRARISLLQLNDCCSRLKLLGHDEEQSTHFAAEADKLRARLRTIPYFLQLPKSVQETCLAGKKAWFMDRAQLVGLVGIEKRAFDAWWDLTSQHSHIHPMSFFRNVVNERGSGLELEPDRSYLTVALAMSAEALEACTNKLIEIYPDVAWAKKGIDSKFNPGPKHNRCL